MIKKINSNFELYRTLKTFMEENQFFIFNDNGTLSYIDNIKSVNPLTEMNNPLNTKKYVIHYNQADTLIIEAGIHFKDRQAIYENFVNNVVDSQACYHSYFLNYDENEAPILYYFNGNAISIIETEALMNEMCNSTLATKINEYGEEKLANELNMDKEELLNKITYGQITFELMTQLKNSLNLTDQEATDCFLRRR